MTTLLIRGGTLLDPAGGVRRGDVRIEGRAITEVRTGLAASPRDEVIEASDHLVMPGLVNAHTHSGQHLDRGAARNLPLDLWLIWVVYGGVSFTPDDAYVLALAGADEMLRTGCTSVLDHPWVAPGAFEQHAEAVMQAYFDAGIRAGVAPMIQDRDIFESFSYEGLDVDPPEPLGPPLDPTELIGHMRRFFDRWQGTSTRVFPMIGPSAPQRCSNELMVLLAALASERGALFHTHVLETKSQIVATRRRYRGSVVSFLEEIGLLNSRCSLAHCVWMDPTEYAAVRDAGAVVVHNPVSNLRCGSGLLPLGDLLDAGMAIAVGADGAASNDNQNMFEALKFGTLIHTLYGDHRRWPRPIDVWRTSLRAGATALGQRTGGIEPGAVADLVILDMERHVVADDVSLVSSLVLAEHGESVRTVIVDGEVVVDERCPVRYDRADLGRRSRAIQRRIHDHLPSRQSVYDRYEGLLSLVHERDMADASPIRRLADISAAFGPHA